MSWFFASGPKCAHRSHVLSQAKTTPSEIQSWDFAVGPVVKTSPSSARGAGSTPDWRAKIPPAL